MNNNSWFKKEMPLQTVIGFGGGATGFGAHSSSATKTYLDDVFSTYLYTGNASSNQIINGIDNTEGGLVWIKGRDQTINNMLLDTARVSGGLPYELKSDTSGAQAGPYAGYNITSFNDNGFNLSGGGGHTNNSGSDYASWNFRKTPGFFDIVTWTGNGTSGRTVSHSLGSIPGCIMVKCTSAGNNWAVYHKGTTATHYLQLNTAAAAADDSGLWNDTEPTSTEFTVGDSGSVNDNGETYVAYIFAGGESDAATARSVDFTPNSNASLQLSGSSDLDAGTGDYSIEGWIYTTFTGTTRQIIFHSGGADNGSLYLGIASDQIYIANYNAYILQANTGYGGDNESGQWIHVAACRSGSTLKIFKNGIKVASGTDSGDYTSSNGNTASIGFGGAMGVKGKLSNVRFVKGTAVYTSSFRPPTEPLTDVTNTKLLCCNNSSASGATVTPNTITATNSAAASIDSPFDDSSGFKFGADGDQNLVKCGSYVGNGGTQNINIGFEPQWILFKKSNADTGWWIILDSMRGIVNGDNDNGLFPNNDNAEGSYSYGHVTPTGFEVSSTGSVNGNGDSFIYMAIRRPDGYVGKPVTAATKVFAMDYGNASTTIPAFDSGFPVDFGLLKKPGSALDWTATTRLQGPHYVVPNLIDAETAGSAYVWDSNVGYTAVSWADSTLLSWMWKRHAGFDVVTYKGDGVAGHVIPHNLSKSPEMIWIKSRDSITQWCVGHMGRNAGVNPWDYFSALNGTGADENNTIAFNDTAPTSTHFTVGGNDETANKNNYDYVSMLFASADDADGNPISKVGRYTGTGHGGSGSGGSVTVTTGFSPRFIIVKNTDAAGGWHVFDTTRGWVSDVDKVLYLNTTAYQTDTNFIDPSSDGFVIEASIGNDLNLANNYIYYAHA